MRVRVLIGLALVLGAGASPRSGTRLQSGGGTGLRTVIRIGRPEVAPVETLRQAETVAGHILAQAGIQVVWLDCRKPDGNGGEDPCQRDGGATDFWVHLLPHRPSNFHGDVAGFAVLMPPSENADSYAGVSYPAVEEMAKNLEVEPFYVLGATLAHEIGHVLLGSKSHSRTGIMSPRVNHEQLVTLSRGELLFTSEQAVRLRERVTLRERNGGY